MSAPRAGDRRSGRTRCPGGALDLGLDAGFVRRGGAIGGVAIFVIVRVLWAGGEVSGLVALVAIEARMVPPAYGERGIPCVPLTRRA
jgi:hypothetical protein